MSTKEAIEKLTETVEQCHDEAYAELISISSALVSISGSLDEMVDLLTQIAISVAHDD